MSVAVQAAPEPAALVPAAQAPLVALPVSVVVAEATPAADSNPLVGAALLALALFLSKR